MTHGSSLYGEFGSGIVVVGNRFFGNIGGSVIYLKDGEDFLLKNNQFLRNFSPSVLLYKIKKGNVENEIVNGGKSS